MSFNLLEAIALHLEEAEVPKISHFHKALQNKLLLLHVVSMKPQKFQLVRLVLFFHAHITREKEL